MIFKKKGTRMSKTKEAEPVLEETAEPKTESEEKPQAVVEKPSRVEPESHVQVTAAKAVVEVPIDCDDVVQTDALVNHIATAKALASSKVSKIIKVARNAKTKATETRPMLNMAAKKVVVEVTFEPAVGEDIVKAAQEAV